MLTEKRLPEGKAGAAGAYFPGGKYSYRKDLFGAEEYRDKSVYLEFEGVYMKSSVYLNGEKIGGHIYGYTGFYVDLTDKLRIGSNNEIRVVADNTQIPNTRWYSGSGIYRNVNLITGDKRHIKLEGIKVATESIDPAVISVQTEVENDEGLDIKVEVYEYKKGFDTTGKVKRLEAEEIPICTG
ncbi:MAG: sugar-binding domain-containing protein [Mediterraneibacter faecis]